MASGNVGRHAVTLDETDIVPVPRASVEREGSQTAFAKRHGLERTYLSNVLNGKRPVGRTIVKVLGAAESVRHRPR